MYNRKADPKIGRLCLCKKVVINYKTMTEVEGLCSRHGKVASEVKEGCG